MPVVQRTTRPARRRHVARRAAPVGDIQVTDFLLPDHVCEGSQWGNPSWKEWCNNEIMRNLIKGNNLFYVKPNGGGTIAIFRKMRGSGNPS